MNFDFLNNISLKETPKKEKINNTAGRIAMERNPSNGASIRLFKDGSIYPSQELVDKYDLEYREKNDANQGYGFDVFSSKNWNLYPDNAQHVVFITAVPKKAGNVDLFSSARKGKEGTIISVMEQGSTTFGKELIEMIQDVYGVALFEDNKYVDLTIVQDAKMTSLDDIYFIPKMINKGAQKGTWTTVRRENLVVNPLAIYVENSNVPVEAEHETAFAE